MRTPVTIYMLDNESQTPTRNYKTDAGDDLYTLEDTTIDPFARGVVPTGVRVRLPSGHWGRITARSSTIGTYGLFVIEGIIDNEYTGPLFVSVFNMTQKPVVVPKGARIAQFILQEIVTTEYERIPTLPTTARGSKGFGSSGT